VNTSPVVFISSRDEGIVEMAANAFVRFVNCAPGVETATLRLGGARLSDVAYGEATEYETIETGPVEGRAEFDGGSVDAGMRSETNERYSVYLTERDGVRETLVLEDRPAPKDGRGYLRFLNAAAGPRASLSVDGGETLSLNIGYRRNGSYRELVPGRYELTVSRSDSGEHVTAIEGLDLAGGVAHTVVLHGAEEFDALVLTDAAPARIGSVSD
jgi:hypothetical protein